jgi:hypothetical protein
MIQLGTPMQPPAREEGVTFAASGLRLEGRLALPAEARVAAVVCHPHPEYGGTMDSSVVAATTLALRHAGIATLRFNFRGVGVSEGRYSGSFAEVEDARAAAAVLAEKLPGARLVLGGYSFGAIVALRAGHDEPGIERLFAIALPAPLFEIGFLGRSTKPKLFLLGDRDQYCPFETLEAEVGKLAGENRLARLEGADHFLFGFEEQVGQAVVDFVG